MLGIGSDGRDSLAYHKDRYKHQGVSCIYFPHMRTLVYSLDNKDSEAYHNTTVRTEKCVVCSPFIRTLLDTELNLDKKKETHCLIVQGLTFILILLIGRFYTASETPVGIEITDSGHSSSHLLNVNKTV